MDKGTVPPLLKLVLLLPLPLVGTVVTDESVETTVSGLVGWPRGMVDVTVSVREGLWKVSVTTVVYPAATEVATDEALPVNVPIHGCRYVLSDMQRCVTHLQSSAAMVEVPCSSL